MPDRPQVVKFTENYMDDETRISYYRGDEVVVEEGEFRRASALGAVEHLGSKDEYGEEVQQRKAAGVVLPVEEASGEGESEQA